MVSKARWNAMTRVRGLQDENVDYSDEDYAPGCEVETEDSLFAEESEDASNRTRGPNQGTNGSLVDESGRIILEVGDDRFITPSASRDVSVNLKAYLGGPYPTFRQIPKQKKDLLWDKFKAQYSWPANKEWQVKKAWNTASKDRLRDAFCRAHNEAKKKSGKPTGAANWKGFGPEWLSPEHWNEIIDTWWDNDKWNDKSKVGHANRLTLKSGSITKSTCGSITIAAHKKRLHAKLGKPPTASQLFKRTHRRNEGVGDYVDNKSKIVCEKYDLSIEEKYGRDESSYPEIDIDAWCEASQGPSKGGHLYGLGIRCPAVHKFGSSSNSLSNENDDDITVLKENFCNACAKIDDLTREKEELLQQMDERAQEEERKRKVFEENVLRMLGDRNALTC